MSDNILVVEYEPRYTDRVRNALAGQPFTPSFAKDGEEAMRALDSANPKLIVISSVVPKISTSELIRAIRGHITLQQTPILLTISGYQGKSPRLDAVKMGVSDILPKPYSESEFLGKVQQMLGIRTEGGTPLTSSEIFGELLEEERPQPAAAARKVKATDDVDKMLADTLAGVMPKKKPAAPPADATAAKPKPAASSVDKLVEDTLSGLQAKARPAAPKPQPADPLATQKMPALTPDRIHAAEPLLPKPVEERQEEEEPSDGIRFGSYVLLEKIATGGMAEVWKARRSGVEGFQKIVAIKKILPHLSDNQDFIEMFIDEAKLAAQLNHNNIIHIYDLGKIQGSYYIAMEYVEGWDLKTILRRAVERDQTVSVELALFIASKVAAALDYAHRKRDFEDKEMGLVHRDVSPQNVLISEEGDIKLCDFGIAKAASKASHTQAGALKGKLQYMSPEQAWGRPIDRRSDVFSLAAVLFEMLAGRKLFAGDTEMSILEQVREARVVAPSQFNDEVTPEIDAVVLKALQKGPADRYQTAGELARDLDQILYSFKPTPTSADLAIFMHRLTSPMPVAPPVALEPEPEPEPERVVELKPVASPVAAEPAPAPDAPASAMPAWEAPPAAAEPEEKKSMAMPFAIVAVVVIAAGVGGFLMFRGGNDAQPVAAAAPDTVAVSQPAPASRTVVPADTAAPAPATDTLATATAIDPSMVAEEVQKRLAAERARLEQQARAQQQTQTVAPERPASPPPAPVTQTQPPQVATQTQPPATETRAAQPPPQPPPTQTVAESRPAPTETAAPETARVREGDLVSVSAEGVTPARMTRQATVPYPPVARMQRIQGDVLMSVLVSESGQVLDVRVIRGINRPVGLNEAAVQSVRRSAFTPGTKDGVRVKMWIPVELKFRL